MALKKYLIYKKNLVLYLDLQWELSKKNNWVESSADEISLKKAPSELPGERSITQIGMGERSENRVTDNADICRAFEKT